MNERGYLRYIIPIGLAILFAAYQWLTAERFTNPETGKTVRVALSESQEDQLGLQAYRQTLAEASQQGAVLQSGPEYDRVRRVAERLVHAVDAELAKGGAATGGRPRKFNWAVSVVNSRQINAFCLPGGKIVVYTGLLPVADNDARLAAVMGHEIAHATLRHGSQRMLQQKLFQTVQTGAAVSLSGLDYDQQRMIMGALGAGAQYGYILPFSRDNENEADGLGLMYAAKAGYDPREAVELWKRMGQASGGKGPPEFASTHPSGDTRIRRLTEEMPKALAEYEKSPMKGQ